MTKCKILFLAANPVGTNPLALDEESRQIDQKIRAAEHRDALELITKWAVHPDDLLDYLNQYRPHVVHFSGHGTDAEQILLADDSKRAKPVSAAALKQLFTTLKDNIRVVVLNACYSEAQAQAIVQVIDCTIGMKREIGDEAAIAFAAAFYRAVGCGRSVQDAFDQGKTALMLHGIPEETTPALLVRQGIDPRTLYLVSGPKPAQDPDVEEAPRREPPVETSPTAPMLNEVLVGAWQVRIRMPFPAVEGQMRVEMNTNGLFRGELASPLGMSMVEGQWQANAISKQIALQGRQSNGFHVGPYAVMIQVNSFNDGQIEGFTNAGEQVSWQRVGPSPVLFQRPPPIVAGKEPPRLREVEPLNRGRALNTWREKLDYLQQQEAVIADPAQKFALQKEIEEAKAKVRDLGG